MKYVCPLITVSDMKQSRDFYENLLDQKVKYDFGESVTFHGDFAIHLQSHYKKLIDNRVIKSGGNNFELYFESDTVELIVDKLKGNGILLVHELREQPWRQKVVRFYDPDNNIIEIGERLEHLSFRLKKENLSNEEISKITNMPIDFVIDSIQQYEQKNRAHTPNIV
jgi:catechol 2,3-dioxygenase-like lactoylglutathione lyase family enzyme